MSRYLPVLLIGVLFGALVVSAQVNTGTISGVVQDPSGAVISGATVTVKNVDTGTARTLTSDAAGRYIAPVLPVGNYEVRGEQTGFQTEIRSGITLTVGREEVINFTLRVGQLTAVVEVTAEAPLVETTTAAMSSLVDERTIRDLPLNGRSYDQLALTQPGVVSVGAGQASVAFDFGTGTRFNVNGSRAYANTFLLDGTVLNDHANATPGGAAGNNLGVDGVQEFKINTSVSPAEYGRSSGGVISAVTRSGTNSLHGSAFGFLRNSALDSLGFFDYKSHNPDATGKVAPYRRGQFGGSLGGPIKKDKTFFFGTYEGLRQGNGTIISPQVPTAQTKLGIVPFAAFQGTDPTPYNCHKGDTACTVPVSNVIKPYLDLFQSPGNDLGDGTGIFSAAPLQVTGEDYFMTRIDHQISENMRIFVRYSFDKDSNVLPNFNGSAVADEHDVARRQYSTIQVNNTLRPTLFNSFRFAYNRTYQNFDDVISNPKVANLPNGGSFAPGQHFGTISFGSQGLSTQPLNFLGIDNGAPRVYRYNSFQEGDDLTYIRGAHAFKWGVSIERIQDNEITESNTRGDYTFLDIPAFLTNTPLGYQAASPGATGYRGLRTTMFGAYAQDDFRVTQRLTLNLGLRWEAITNPTEVNGKMANLLNIKDSATTVLKDSYFSVAKKDFQPRVGLAWRLNGRGTTVLRAGFGMFHDHILPYSYVGFASNTPPFFSSLNDSSPVFPIDTNLTSGVPPPAQFTTLPTTIREPIKTQYTLTFQQQVMKNTVLEVAYIGSESHHLQRQGELNPIVPINGVFPKAASVTSCRANPALVGCRVNPNFASLPTFRFDGNADYNALQVIVRRRSVSGLQFQVFYTYSQSLDTKSSIAGGETRQEPNTVLDFLNPGLDRGRSSFDARHNLVPTITYPFPFKFQRKALEVILGGWTVNGIGTFRTGEPFTGRVGSNNSRNGDRWSPDRPNLNPGFSNNPTSGVTKGCTTAGGTIIPAGQQLGTWNLWYDPCAFSKPAAGTYGNLGRNTITGPRLFNVDFSTDKNFKLTERINMQFRAEIFNLLDEAHFYAPGFNVFSGSAGVTKTLISTPGGRLVQFGLKVLF